MQVHVVNHMRHGFQIHKVGCADIAREQKARRVNSDWVQDVPAGKTIAQAVADEIADSFGWEPDSGEPQPWPPELLRVMPCCPKPSSTPATQE